MPDAHQVEHPQENDVLAEPSEVQQRSGATFDRIVGNSVNAGITAWLAAATGSPEAGAAIGGMIGPLSEELSFALRKAVGIQQARGQYMLDEAASRLNLSVADLLDESLEDPTRVELLWRSIETAARATSETKLHLISELLASGALAEDDTVVDEQIIALDAIGQLETPHFRLLLTLADPSPVWWDSATDRLTLRYAWPEDRIIERDPGLINALPALAAKLEGLGIAREVGTSGGKAYLWELTSFGRLCVQAIRSHADEGTDRLHR